MKRTPEEERIFRALAQIETPEADLSAALRRAEEPRRIRPVRPLAAAAVLCALLTIGAAAVGFSGAWRYFAPSLPQNAVQTVGASQTSGDYTLTVEEAVVDDSNFMLLLALTRADGEAIDPEASLTTNSMDLEVTVDGHYFGRATDYQLSPDGKTIYICYENTGALTETSILGKPITLTADGVAVRLFDDDGNIRIQCDNPISLSALTEWGTPDFSAVPLVDHVEEIIQTAANGGAALPLFTVEGVPLLTLRGAALTSEGLALVTQDASYVSGDLAYTRSSCEAIIDTRTGARYLCRSGHGAALEDGTWAFLEVFDDCPFTLEDLPYLEVEVSYTVDRILSDQPFWLTFTVEKSSGWKLPLDDVLELDWICKSISKMKRRRPSPSIGTVPLRCSIWQTAQISPPPGMEADIWTLLCLWCHSKPLMPTAIGCSSTPHRWFPSPLEIWRSPWSTDLFPSPKTARPV